MVILVEKEHKLNQILETNLKYEDDLLKIKNKKVKNFLDKYQEYFETGNREKLKEFYDKTGISLTHMYICNDEEIYLNMYGCVLKKDINELMFNHHLLIIEKVDKIDINEQKVIINEKCELTLKNIDYEYGNNIRSYICNFETLNEKIEYIKSIFDISYVNEGKIKQVMFDPLNNLLILLDSGELYVGDKLYENDVDYIFEECASHYLLIYKSNKIESYISKFVNMCCYDNDKVLYDNNYLITLHNKIVNVTILSDFELDTVIISAFDNVDDIKMEDDEMLILIKGKEHIIVPLYSYHVMCY